MRVLAGVATLASLVTGLVAWDGADRTAFSGTFAVDASTGAARVIVTSALLLLLAVAGGDLRDHPRESETCSLLLFGGAEALLLARLGALPH